MALNPLREDRDEVTVGDMVIAGLLFACLGGLVINAASNLDRHRDELADLRRERDEWRARAAVVDGDAVEVAAEAVWRDILFTDNAVVDNIALYDLRCSQEARCSMLVSWPAYTPGSTRGAFFDLDVRLSPAPDFLP